ncbi:hypothetical protein GQR58_029548 [Nymphon striatum]|nr:hypothetical protein GQR58_029548 [Nymphon striatum]
MLTQQSLPQNKGILCTDCYNEFTCANRCFNSGSPQRKWGILVDSNLIIACAKERRRPCVAPYDSRLQRLSEVLGSVHYLRNLCGEESNQWRDQMSGLLTAAFAGIIMITDEKIAELDEVIAQEKRVAAREMQSEAWADGIMEGIDCEILAEAAIATALEEVVRSDGEEAALALALKRNEQETHNCLYCCPIKHYGDECFRAVIGTIRKCASTI